ncbi:putative uncharacterized protein DDB_G0282499 [Aphidius gifuensis]|uniref:putative uncharacterized protein DDB_G0282499 n=1 Tax=Aphidius gifuensis TaxID=684658 RepID=UPI001CDC355E|nr:putative uncharacterized protein DDB_G0282499 [Aphidius gifuensis]
MVSTVDKIKVAADLVITDNEQMSNEILNLTKRLSVEKKREVKVVQANKIEKPSEVVSTPNNNFSRNFPNQRYNNNFPRINNNFNSNYRNYRPNDVNFSNLNNNSNAQKNLDVNSPEATGSNPVGTNNNTTNTPYNNSYRNSTNGYPPRPYHNNNTFYNSNNNSNQPTNNAVNTKYPINNPVNNNGPLPNDNTIPNQTNTQDRKFYNKPNYDVTCPFCRRPGHDMNTCYALQNAQMRCLERQAQKNGGGPVNREGVTQPRPPQQPVQPSQSNQSPDQK